MHILSLGLDSTEWLHAQQWFHAYKRPLLASDVMNKVARTTMPQIVVCFTFQKPNGNDACMHLCKQLAQVQHMTVGDSTPFLYSSMSEVKFAGIQ